MAMSYEVWARDLGPSWMAGQATVTCQAQTSTFSSSNATCEPRYLVGELGGPQEPAQCGNLSASAFTATAATRHPQPIFILN